MSQGTPRFGAAGGGQMSFDDQRVHASPTIDPLPQRWRRRGWASRVLMPRGAMPDPVVSHEAI
jgi:hypothetical protein